MITSFFSPPFTGRAAPQFGHSIGIPLHYKLLIALRPYAYGEDVSLDDLYAQYGEDVVLEWRNRYGEDVPIMGYMIPEDRQTEMFAILGDGLWFDSEGVAKQVNNIELALSPEINQWAIWYRLDAAAGTGKREVLFYNPDTLLYSDYIKISNYFRNISGLYDAILYYDAEEDPDTELTGGPSTFNSAILGPQYRRNSDGTYTAVSAGGPIVDTFNDGFVGLRSCGAVANLLPSGGETFASELANLYTPILQGADYYNLVPNSTNGFHDVSKLRTVTAGQSYTFTVEFKAAQYSWVALRVDGINAFFNLAIGALGTVGVGLSASIQTNGSGGYICTVTRVVSSSSAYFVIRLATSDGVTSFSGNGSDSILARYPIITATAYPVPYVPPGVTQPASNATATGGNWFTNPDGSPLWESLDGEPDGVELATNPSIIAPWSVAGGVYSKIAGVEGTIAFNGNVLKDTDTAVLRFTVISISGGSITPYISGANQTPVSSPGIYRIVSKAGSSVITECSFYAASGATCSIRDISVQRIQPQPLTLATRIKMGVGSADLPANTSTNAITCASSGGTVLMARDVSGSKYPSASSDGTNSALPTAVIWTRNAIVRRYVQVSTAGTQFRVGYMIEGTHTAPQWGSWAAYDGSFNPSTLYQLMLGYNNPYPMWLNKLAVWKRQVSDTELLGVFS